MLKILAKGVSFLPGDDTEGPSPKIGLVFGREKALLFDTSNDIKRLNDALSELKKRGPFAEIFVVISHFHPDHCALVSSLPSTFKVLASRNTARYLPGSPIIVSNEIALDLGDISAKIIPVPSLHAKGCLDLLANSILFVGDALYSRQKGNGLFYNKEIAVEMKKKYDSIPFKTVVPSHDSPMLEKEKVMVFLNDLVVKGTSVYQNY